MTPRHDRSHPAGRQRAAARGFGAIAAIVVLVLLAALAAAIVRIGGTAQATQAQDLLGARAWQAARAGTEWGLYQALKGSWTTCAGASQTLDLRAESAGMVATVSCSSATYNEGEASPGVPQQRRVITIDTVACNAGACPDNSRATQPGYVERRRQVQVVR
jgi:MSHA biogenesis protein MshP